MILGNGSIRNFFFGEIIFANGSTRGIVNKTESSIRKKHYNGMGKIARVSEKGRGINYNNNIYLIQKKGKTERAS